MIKYTLLETLSVDKPGISKLAGFIYKNAHRADFDYEVEPGYLYVRSRAISSRCNDNYDEFPAEEIKKAYKTFIGKPVFVNHKNDDHRKARGVIIDAALHEDTNHDGTPDTWVEVLMQVDAVKFPKLAQAILAGEVDRTSMGTDVNYSLCSACGNKATTPAEYCSHIPQMKGNLYVRRNASTGRPEKTLIREICYGLKFFENSLLVEPPADPTAYLTGVDDKGLKLAVTAARSGGLSVFVASSKISVAGLAVMAADTGRVLLLQRSFEDKKDPARGDWEFPGGHLEADESPIEGAIREWKEETGHPLPEGHVINNWTSKIYQGFVYQIEHESDITINLDHEDKKIINPDDRDGDWTETLAWFDPKDLPEMPSLRKELKGIDWGMFNISKSALLKFIAEEEEPSNSFGKPSEESSHAHYPLYDKPKKGKLKNEFLSNNNFYHGTNRDFERFSLSPPPETGYSPHTEYNTGIGPHFAADPGLSSHFSTGPKGRKIQVNLNIHNPMHYESEEAMSHHAMHVAHKQGLITDEEHDRYREISPNSVRETGYFDPQEHLRERLRSPGRYDPEEQMHRSAIFNDNIFKTGKARDVANALKEHLQSRGFDGITYHNDIEGRVAKHPLSVIAFHPDQVEIKNHHWTFRHKASQENEKTCPHCNGRGETWHEGTCPVCDGQGTTQEDPLSAFIANVDEYGGGHQPSEGPPIHNLLEPFKDGEWGAPDDIYDHPQYYQGNYSKEIDGESNRAIRNARGKGPEHPVTIYRAAPKGVTHFDTGNWVTPSQGYAKGHALHEHDDDKNLPVYKATVPAKHVRWAGDDLNEFGYFGPKVKAEIHHPGGPNAASVKTANMYSMTGPVESPEMQGMTCPYCQGKGTGGHMPIPRKGNICGKCGGDGFLDARMKLGSLESFVANAEDIIPVPVRARHHPYQDIKDSGILADHMASSHGVDPDVEGWKRSDLLDMHRDMHS